MAKRIKCSKCGGSGREESSESCCCGTGEGCTLHNAAARSLWLPKCSACKGSGKAEGRQA